MARSASTLRVATVWLVGEDWARELNEGLRRDASALGIICPFIKHFAVADILGRHSPRELRVITRFNLADFGAGVSDIAALRSVLDAGGRVRGLRGLHAKVFIFGNVRAAVTSANLTARGLRGNHEFGCVSEQPEFVTACASYFERLWTAAGANLTRAQLDDWEATVGRFLDSGGRSADQAKLPDHGAVAASGAEWPLSVPDTTGPGWPAESGQAFVKFFGEGHNRVPWSFNTLEEVERSGCHWACTYPDGKRPRAVRDGDTLFVGRLVRDPNDTLIFGRAIGRAHRPGQDDASSEEIGARPWKAQWPHYIRVHHGRFVAGSLRNGVSLNALMDDLGSDAFASTQDNARARNSGNVDPRRAYRQQPAVRLSRDGAAWITCRLEEAFGAHGVLPDAELAALDWPGVTQPRGEAELVDVQFSARTFPVAERP
jgi:hypothetical protein